MILCHITASRTTDSVVSRAVQQGIGLDDPPENFSVFVFSFSYFLHIIFELIVYVSSFPVVIWTYVFSVFLQILHSH